MKIKTLFIGCALLCTSAMAQTNDDKQLEAKFDKILSAQFKSEETGATVLVARKGEVIYKKAFGMANLELNVPMKFDNVFRIGSITKQFTAVAILQLMEQGKLGLQDEITKFIPDYPTHGYKITIEHLLTHTSGIHSFTSMKDYEERMMLDLKPEEIIDHFKNQPMNFAPGTEWNYSNSGYFLLGYIIEKVSGKTYGEYIEENIFKPAGMINSVYGSDTKLIRNRVGTYSKNENVYENAMAISMTQPFAAGSLLSTVEDMFKWNRAVHSYQLVKKESLDKAFAPYKLADGTLTEYGYGWALSNVQESPTIEHGGGINGSVTMSIYLPKEDVYVVVFSNCDCFSPKEIAVNLAGIAIGKPYDYKEITVESKMLKTYAGVYENSKGELRIISFADDKLYSQRGRNQKFIIKAFEKDKFFFEDATLRIEFSRNKKGEVSGLTTKGRNGSEIWNRTNKPVPTVTEINVNSAILEKYVGEYEITPEFTFVITKEDDKLFLKATGQEKVEIFAETETKFFLKVNDAQLEFVKDDAGKVSKAILNQGGRKTEALKIK